MLVATKPDRDAAARKSLATTILSGSVHVSVMNGGHAQTVPRDAVDELMDGWETWIEGGRVQNGSQYRGARPLIHAFEVDFWLGPEPQAPIAKTGAPGRPSSMGIVMAEFERRRGNGGCESSRQAEADALAAWLARTHPEAPTLKAKSIFNKLPADFQPFKIDCPKL